MYLEGYAKYAIAKMHSTSNIHLRGFINSNVINIGSLIDTYNDQVILRIVQVIRYGLNTLLNTI